jgi:hypothetical protein
MGESVRDSGLISGFVDTSKLLERLLVHRDHRMRLAACEAAVEYSFFSLFSCAKVLVEERRSEYDQVRLSRLVSLAETNDRYLVREFPRDPLRFST